MLRKVFCLGVTIDFQLDFDKHISEICKKKKKKKKKNRMTAIKFP